ncbi:hypothetical protein PIB30_052420 [Stylosanthes scabra]|uniref:Uncharacterized protein n=1 Tax=Stylosanthes scabra TaxID=79078 RepID=A0ABU6SI60_9FABA|nr:hypothetical protein [Stylosanthes scabra]
MAEGYHCLPPLRRKSCGRLKLYARKKYPSEDTPIRSQVRNATKLKITYGKFTYRTCGDDGHTTRGFSIAKRLKVEAAENVEGVSSEEGNVECATGNATIGVEDAVEINIS